MKKMLYTLFVFICVVAPSYAVHLPESMTQSMKHDYGIPSFTQLIISMVLVVGLIYFTGWIYTKLNVVNHKQLRKIASDKNDSMRFTVLQSMPLGQQRHIYTIEMNGKILLVGSTPSQINLIKEFDNVEDVDLNIDGSLCSENESASKKEAQKINIDELYKKYKS